MSIIQGTAKGGSTSFYDYPIGDSLRFDGSSGYLTRSPSSSGNRTTWTFSVWVKISDSSGFNPLFTTGNWSSGSTATGISLYESQFSIYWNAPAGGLSTSSLYRDYSSWYHLVLTANTTTLTLYVNGISIITKSISSSDEVNNNNSQHAISQYSNATSAYWNGYMANIQFIDGQALDASYFGETKDDIWVPYNAFSTAGSGTATASDGDTATDSYGTNGFHLTFEDGIESLPVGGYTGNQNAFRDKSHNTNHWKIN